MSIEEARQNVVRMIKFEKICKKKTPKGKVYKGLKGEFFAGKTHGVRFKPIYEKIK